jgi:hypothetical protein
VERIVTRVGWADFGDFEHFGARLYRDVAGRTSFLQLVVFALGAGRLSDADVAVLDDVATCCHVADPRIWPLKIARLAASGGRAVTGHLAACVVLDGDFIGAHAAEAAAELLLSARHAVDAVGEEGDEEGVGERVTGALDELLARHPAPPGFGLQARREDERVLALQKCLVARGRADRPYWALATALWAAARRRTGLEPNAFGAIAAACLDLGLGPSEIGALTSLLLQPSLLANAFEGARLRSPALARMPDAAITYTGSPPRESPRAVAARRTATKPTPG